MERLGKEYAPIVEGIGCSNNSHRKQSWSPMAMTDTILATGNTGTVGTEEFCKTALRKRHQLPEIKSIFESRLNPRRDRGKQCNDCASLQRAMQRRSLDKHEIQAAWEKRIASFRTMPRWYDIWTGLGQHARGGF